MFQSLSGWKDSDMQAVSAAKKREDRLAAAAEAGKVPEEDLAAPDLPDLPEALSYSVLKLENMPLAREI